MVPPTPNNTGKNQAINLSNSMGTQPRAVSTLTPSLQRMSAAKTEGAERRKEMVAPTKLLILADIFMP